MKKSYGKVTKCRICASTKLYRFLNLGKQPIPNGFLKKEDLEKKENKFELSCFFCQKCGLVQLTRVVNPEIMFKNYVYVPSGARMMMNNFSNLFYFAQKKLKLNSLSKVIDIGSNDGSLLRFFKNIGVQVLGIDPAQNLAIDAAKRGIPTEVGLFDSTLANNILAKYGKVDLITATNVIAHINNLHEVLKGVGILLKERGFFITEFPYLPDLLRKNQFDTIYHEHLSYFSLKPWKYLIEKFDFEIVDISKLLIHGGSIRLVHQRNLRKSAKKTLDFLIRLEEEQGLYAMKSFDNFAKRINELKKQLQNLLKDLKLKGKKIVGLGAAAKGNVLTNFFDIGPETLDFIGDSTVLKHGLYTPGKHIPVYPESELYKSKPDFALILAWNFADEIIKKHERFQKNGGQFIIPVPEVRII